MIELHILHFRLQEGLLQIMLFTIIFQLKYILLRTRDQRNAKGWYNYEREMSESCII